MGYPYPNFCLCAFWGSFCGGQGKKEPEKLEAAVSGTEGAVDEIESRSHSMQSQRQRQREREKTSARGCSGCSCLLDGAEQEDTCILYTYANANTRACVHRYI